MPALSKRPFPKDSAPTPNDMTSTPLIDRARAAAAEALKDYTRHDGTPFIGHPDAVAQIVADEIGLPEECIAAVYLHEASRMAGMKVEEAEWGEAARIWHSWPVQESGSMARGTAAACPRRRSWTGPRD